jgi:hypothetical protein
VTQLAGQLGRYEQALAAADVARERLEQFGAEDDLVEVGWSVGLSAAATGDVDRARALAAELAALPAASGAGPVGGPGGGPGGERAQMTLLAHAVRAEVARSEGDPARAVVEYRRAWGQVLPHRREASQWVMVVGAALLAAQDEAAADGAARDETGGGRSTGAGAGLQDGREARADIARQVRVSALVALRKPALWNDLPVVGTAVLGAALEAVGRGADPALVAEAWGSALRLGARQDFAVLGHGRLRPLVVAAVGEALVADAETASAGTSRAEAVAAARAVLEAIRPSACTPGR